MHVGRRGRTVGGTRDGGGGAIFEFEHASPAPAPPPLPPPTCTHETLLDEASSDQSSY